MSFVVRFYFTINCETVNLEFSFLNGSLWVQTLIIVRYDKLLNVTSHLGTKYSVSVFCEVFCMGSAFTCTGSACFAYAVVMAGVEGVVVLKGVASLGTVGVVLDSYWHCTALCLFCMSFNIWNTFDVPFNVPLPVLT